MLSGDLEFNLFERHFQEGEEAFFSIDALEFMVELLQRQQALLVQPLGPADLLRHGPCRFEAASFWRCPVAVVVGAFLWGGHVR